MKNVHLLTPNTRIIKTRIMVRYCDERYVLRSIDRFIERDEIVYFCLVEPFYKKHIRHTGGALCTCQDNGRGYSLMKILLNIPTAANVMQDATFQNNRRFLSFGKTQSMLYSFFTTMVGYSVLHWIRIFLENIRFYDLSGRVLLQRVARTIYEGSTHRFVRYRIHE